MIARYTIIAAAVAGFGFSILPARSDEYPVLDVVPLCHGITNQSDLQDGLPSATFDKCLKAEQIDRETMIKEWPDFSSDDKKHCTAEAIMGGDSSYTDLITCLEMARDVRALHAADKSQPNESAQQSKTSKRKRGTTQ